MKPRPPGRLEGIVVKADGTPLAGARPWLLIGLSIGGTRNPVTTTDYQGRFAFDEIPPGEFLILGAGRNPKGPFRVESGLTSSVRLVRE